jgi:hypothetical protein
MKNYLAIIPSRNYYNHFRWGGVLQCGINDLYTIVIIDLSILAILQIRVIILYRLGYDFAASWRKSTCKKVTSKWIQLLG